MEHWQFIWLMQTYIITLDLQRTASLDHDFKFNGKTKFYKDRSDSAPQISALYNINNNVIETCTHCFHGRTHNISTAWQITIYWVAYISVSLSLLVLLHTYDQHVFSTHKLHRCVLSFQFCPSICLRERPPPQSVHFLRLISLDLPICPALRRPNKAT